MSIQTCYLNPTALPTVKSDESVSHKYSLQIYVNKGGNKETNVYSGQASQDVSADKRDEVFTMFLEAIAEIIKIHTSQNYIPPTTNPTVDSMTTLQQFKDHFANVASNNGSGGYDFSTNSSGRAKLDFIAERFFMLYSRAQLHILTSQTSTDICPDGDGSRIFHMEIENCLFSTTFTYN